MLERFGEIATAREVKFAPCDLKSVEADGTFSGYASLFGAVDLGQDLVMPGAFAQSLDARGARGVKLLFQHDPNEPIGVWLELNEDDKGLFARGRRSAGALRPIDRGAGRKQGGGHCLRDRHTRSRRAVARVWHAAKGRHALASAGFPGPPRGR